jgi:hypothetical protein
MIVRNDCTTFKVMGEDIHLYSEDLGYGLNTVADMGRHFHYMGNEPCNVATAIFAWQEVNGRDLTNEELRQVMVDNHLISEAI